MAALLWGMGLSHQHVSLFLTALGCSICKMSRPRSGVEVIGVDETVEKVKGNEVVLGFVVDVKRGETLGIDVLLKQDASAFVGWLRRYAEALGVKVIVSDDLATYKPFQDWKGKPVVEELGVEHQVCLAHVRKNLTRRLKR